ncbi:MAG: hypothetical protein ACJA0E_001381 [Bermanella sp.]|jgi:hypothetical protein
MNAHGHFDIWLDNRVVLANLEGQWNEEMALIFAESFKKAAEPLLGEDWAHIVYLDEWRLGVPEFEPIIIDLVNFCIENGLTHYAQVYCSSTLKKYQIKRVAKKTLANSILKSREFTNKDEAFAWLREGGYSIDEEESSPPKD